MNTKPITIEALVKGTARDYRLLAGWLMDSLIKATGSLRPNLVTLDRPKQPYDLPSLRSAITVRPPERRSRWVRRLMNEDGETGQGLAEYALILALIAIVAVIALLFLGTQIAGTLSDIGNSIVPDSSP